MPSTTSIFLNICSTQLQDTALVLKSNPNITPNQSSSSTEEEEEIKEVILTNNDLLQARNKGRVAVRGIYLRVYSSFRNQSLNSQHLALGHGKLSLMGLMNLVVPTMTLVGAILSYFLVDATGWEAIFPSSKTNQIVVKVAAWGTLMFMVAYEHSYHWYGSSSSSLSSGGSGMGMKDVSTSLGASVRNSITGSMGMGMGMGMGASSTTSHGNMGFVGLEVQIEEPLLPSTTITTSASSSSQPLVATASSVSSATSRDIANDSSFEVVKKSSSPANASVNANMNMNGISTTVAGTAASTSAGTTMANKPKLSVATSLPNTSAASTAMASNKSSASATSVKSSPMSTKSMPTPTSAPTNASTATPTSQSYSTNTTPKGPSSTSKSTPTPTPTSNSKPTTNPPTSSSPSKTSKTPTTPTLNAPQALPFRFIRAEKGNIDMAKKRWAETLQWRKDLGMDTILSEPHPQLAVIKENYPHYFHLRGKKNEPCYYEQPAKMKLAELKSHGIEMEGLLRHYAICTEYMWKKIEDSEDGKSIYVIDLEGIGIRDFAGEVVDFVKRASSFTADHYPERSGGIFVINVPSWFSVIWNVVKPMVDEVTKKKIKILRHGKAAITAALQEKIPLENIPPEYGGTSMKLGYSPEEIMFRDHFAKLNEQANK